MGISLDITRESWGAGKLDWLATRKGFDTCRSGTVDISLFLPEHMPDGFIPSGIVLSRVDATGLLGPAGGAGVTGNVVGHMLHDVRVADRAGNPFGTAAVAVLWEGVVLIDKLPTFTGGAAAIGVVGATGVVEKALPNIRYELTSGLGAFREPVVPV